MDNNKVILTTKREYVLKYCEFFNDKDGLFIETEGIVGSFSGRAFGGIGYTKDMCLEEIIQYFDDEYNHKYEGKMFPFSCVQFVLRDVGWGELT